MKGFDKTFPIFLLTVAFFSTASSDNVIQIRKYCPVGQVLTKFPAEDQCLEVVAGKKWKGILYESETFKRLDPSKDKQIQRKYLDTNLTCEDHDWVRLSAKPAKENDEPLFILLSNGKLMWRSDNCTSDACRNWEPFPAQFYIDGIGYPTNGTSGALYSGQEYDQLLYYCNSHLSKSQGIANRLSTANIFIILISILTFTFYLLTTIVYILLWSSQPLAGRVLVSVVLSRAISTFVYFVSFIGFLYNWDVNVPHWWCLFIGVLTYYFFNSCYSWTVLLNFDLWWSFRSMRASGDTQENIRRKFIHYSCFGWGSPLVISAVTILIDFSSSNANPSLVPNYGTDCFIAESSHYVYLVLVQFVYLVPGLIFGVLTFYALYQVRKNAGTQQGSKSTSSFQLNFKLFVVLGLGWVLNILLAWIIIPSLSGVESEILLVLELLVLLLDSLGTAMLTFWIYVCKKSTLRKLEQKYQRFYAFTNRLREIKQSFKQTSTAPTSSIEADSKTQASNSSTNV